MSDAILEPILRSPMLPKLVGDLNAAVESEQKARAEFFEMITPEMKAEFILGEVFFHSPARAKHLGATGELFVALHQYCKRSGNGCVFSEKCLVSLTRNDFESDIVWFSSEKAAEIEPDQMRFPAPDFVIEVLSESTEGNDRGIKFDDFALHGVREYWIVDTDVGCVEQYILDEGATAFRLHEKLTHGVVQSKVIEGFECGIEAIFGK